MKGRIVDINRKRGMVGVLTDDASYSIFELLDDDEVEINDEIAWDNDTSLGHTYILNKTKSNKFEVYFQNHDVSKANLKKQLLYSSK
jgi:hypothetical protein